MIFLDLTKAYDALDRSRCLGILLFFCLLQALQPVPDDRVHNHIK